MSSQTLSDTEPKMRRAIEVMERDFGGIRTGRASPAIVERIPVEYYGTPTPLNQLAGISVPEAHMIVIQPWDRSVLGAIEKAILRSEVGLIPNVDGAVVRLVVPPLSEERRRELVRVVHKRMEECRVEIRQLRLQFRDWRNLGIQRAQLLAGANRRRQLLVEPLELLAGDDDALLGDAQIAVQREGALAPLDPLLPPRFFFGERVLGLRALRGRPGRGFARGGQSCLRGLAFLLELGLRR